MTERQNKILLSVVERFIASGEPVGSKVICPELNISSATVRNEMSVLSDLGFLEQTHTSSGRVPSQKGIRYYVTNLMNSSDLGDKEKFLLQIGLSDVGCDPSEVLSRATFLLSEMTGFAVLATTPDDKLSTVRSVELVPLDKHEVLLIVKMNTGVIKLKDMRLDFDFTNETAELFYQVQRNFFENHSSVEFTPAFIQSLVSSFGSKILEIAPFLSSLSALCHEATVSELKSHGLTKLLRYREIDADSYLTLDRLVSTGDFARLLNDDKQISSVYVGSQNSLGTLESVSIVSSKYFLNGKPIGSLAVVGPMRMDYQRIIPAVKFMCDLITSILQ